ncbi:MAG: tRNA (cytidine(56)-2'-O)-methyltransferase [Methanobacteriota archaeon]
MISVLRIGHRPSRDKRVTTHVALTARAFGASEVMVSTQDAGLEATIEKLVPRWGGDFRIKTGVSWKTEMRKWRGVKVHLTMYGEHLDDALPKIPRDSDILIIVGAEKVPAEVYQMADFNVAVGNQPHSEVAALGVFLDRLLSGEGLRSDLAGSTRVVPNPRGKTVVSVAPVPSRAEALALMKSAGCSKEVIAHVTAVEKLAMQIGRLCGADLELVSAGAILHDIGRSKTHGIMHAVEGGCIAKRLGLPTSIVHIVERHMGAGIPPDEAARFGLPVRDYTPMTLEEKVVAHADNLIGGGRKIKVATTVAKFRRQGLNEAAERINVLHAELGKLCGVDLDEI